MVIRIWSISVRIPVSPYMRIEVGTKAGHKFVIRCRKFKYSPGNSYSFEGMPAFTAFAISVEDIEYMRQLS